MDFTKFASMLYPIFAVAAVALIPIAVGVLVGTVLRLFNAHDAHDDARERALEASIARHPAGKKLGRGHHAAESRPAGNPADPRTD